MDYWSAKDYEFPEGEVRFKLKLETHLFELAKRKTNARNIAVRLSNVCSCVSVVYAVQVSEDGSQFCLFCEDFKIRVFRFLTGKLKRSYDESPKVRGTISDYSEGVRV